MTDAYVMRQMIEAEQADFTTMLRGLTEEQWLAPSLCTGWSVHDVVLHIAWHSHTRDGERFLQLLRARSEARVHAADRELPKDALIDKLAAPAVLGGLANIRTQLAELVIHQQDVRRPLAISRSIPADRMSVVLDFALTRSGGGAFLASSRRRARGLRLVADDVNWAAGTGPEVAGTGDAIYMAINGRHHAIDDLKGDGVPTLAARMPKPK